MLVYAYTGQDERKRRIAQSLIGSEMALISVQVMNEFCHTIRRKFPDSFDTIETVFSELRPYLPIVDLTAEMSREAIRLTRCFGWSFYDSLIVAAAMNAGCPVLLSEDLQHGMVVDGRLRIENSFRPII